MALRGKLLTAKSLIAVTLGAVRFVFMAPGVATAQTIAELIEDPGTFAESNPFWSALYDSGYGYLDVRQTSEIKRFICANREVGIPTDTILPLIEDRGYSLGDAQIMIAVLTSIGTYESAC